MFCFFTFLFHFFFFRIPKLHLEYLTRQRVTLLTKKRFSGNTAVVALTKKKTIQIAEGVRRMKRYRKGRIYEPQLFGTKFPLGAKFSERSEHAKLSNVGRRESLHHSLCKGSHLRCFPQLSILLPPAENKKNMLF